MAFCTYLLRCSDGSYCAGHTDDIYIRLAQRQQGAVSGYTAERRSVVLFWTDHFPTRDDAFAVERRIKGWSRAKKEALIAGDRALVSQLARGRTGPKMDAGVAPGPLRRSSGHASTSSG